MLSKILSFVKLNLNDIILFIVIALAISLSFALGYITAKYQLKPEIQIEQQ